MREKRTIQPSIFEIYPEHDIGRELKAMSKLLDAHPDLLDWVAADIKDRQPKATGRKGLSVDTVLRCAILKQYRQLSYEELVFCLMDSSAYQAFARLCGTWVEVGLAALHQRHICGDLGTNQPAVARGCTPGQDRK